MISRRSLFLPALLLVFSVARAQETVGPRVRLPDEGATATAHATARAAILSKAPVAPAAFAAEHPDWRFRFGGRLGTFHRAWGDGLPIPGFSAISEANVADAASRFVAMHAAALGVRPGELRLLSALPAGTIWYVKYIQQVGGLDVLNAYVDLRISSDGRVVLFGSDFHAAASVSTVPELGEAAAAEFAKAGLDYIPGTAHIAPQGLAVLPLHFPDRTDYRLVYRFTLTQRPDEIWNACVDAHSGSVLWRWKLSSSAASGLSAIATGGATGGATGDDAAVDAASGTTALPSRTGMPANTVDVQVTGSIYRDSYSHGADTAVFPHAYVWIGGTMHATDANGRVTVDLGSEATAPVIARLSGPHARARRADSLSGGKNAVLQTTAIAGQPLLIHWDDDNSTASERNAFFHTTFVRDFIRGMDTSSAMRKIDNQMNAVVNIADSCNAYWDGTRVNFFRRSISCGNTAEIPDVIHHELGHAINTFLYAAVRGSALSSDAISEGTADINANMMRDDPRIGLGFYINGPGGGILRNSENTLRYPEDYLGEGHYDGRILAGAAWDMRKAIGLERARLLTHRAKYGAPDGTLTGEALADYFLEILLADDDDGNLANGTPNSAGIIPAFRAHGIPASGVSIAHTVIADQNTVTEPYPLTATVEVGMAINPALLTAASARVVYSVDGWKNASTADLTVGGDGRSISGAIPPLRAGSIVQYYIEMTDIYGSTERSPATAPASSHTFLVGFLSKMLYDCEAADSWTVIHDCSTGQWVRAKPIGTYNTDLGSPPDVPWVQPDEDHTPGSGKTKCWVTGNALASLGLGENDIDDGSTTLLTRNFDLSGYIDPVLRYYRWYSNNSGATPSTDTWLVQVSADNGATWKDIESTKESFAFWSPIVFRIKDFVPLGGTLRVQFVPSDSGEGSLVEAAVDDIEILDINQALIGIENEARPADLALAQNYPNPFNPSTTVAYTLPSACDVRLSIVTPLGREVAVLADGPQSAGAHRAVFDAGALPSGTYICQLQAGSRRLQRTMLLLR